MDNTLAGLLAGGKDALLPLVDWLLEKDEPFKELRSIRKNLKKVANELTKRLCNGERALHGLPLEQMVFWSRLGVWTRWGLKNRLGAHVVGDLVRRVTPHRLLECPNIGPVSVDTFRRLLWQHYKLRLKGDTEPIP